MKQNIYAVLAALIWGFAFVAQSVSADVIGPFTFTAARSGIAAAALYIAIRVFESVKKKSGKAVPAPAGAKKKLLFGGLVCGVILSSATIFQQAGLSGTSAGKAGFITALYIVIVPILGLFLNRRASAKVWVSVLIAVAGLYCLCIKEDFSITPSDFKVLICAFMFAMHILAVDHFIQYVDGLKLSCAQFTAVTVIAGIGMLLFEEPDWNALIQCIWPILYVGVFSSAVAYTLQILAQKDSNPTVICLLMSLESVFSVVGGALVLHEVMTGKEYLGCALMMVAVVLAQLPERKRSRAQL